MRFFSYALKSVLIQFLCVVVVGPYLLLQAEDLRFFHVLANDLPLALRPYSHLVFYVPLVLAGFLFARIAKLPGVFYKRWIPVLLYPLLIIVFWSSLYIQSGGSYVAESPEWDLLHLITLPPQYVIWRAMRGSSMLYEHIALVLSLVTPENLEYGDGLYFGYLDYFSSWRSLGTPVFMHAAWLAGFGLGAWNKKDTAVPIAQARKGRIPIVLICLGAVGFLGANIWSIERSLVSARHFGDPEQEANVFEDVYIFSFESDNPAMAGAASSLRIRSNYPRMDGATAFYPIYAAAFAGIYEPSAPLATENEEERQKREREFHLLLQCSKTREAYSKLVSKEADIIFAFQPSAEQAKEAEQSGVNLRFIPLGKEAFVFITHKDNPVSSLTHEQIRGIYTRKVTNWNQVGGSDMPIMAFQRPQNSGSQTIMETMVMAGKHMMTPLREELLWEMGGMIVQVAAYRNEAASIGYSFRWYATSRNMENLKFLSVNGVEPSAAHIADGSYAFTAPFYAVVRDEPSSSELEALLGWLSGPEGQALIARVGYVPMR